MTRTQATAAALAAIAAGTALYLATPSGQERVTPASAPEALEAAGMRLQRHLDLPDDECEATRIVVDDETGIHEETVIACGAVPVEGADDPRVFAMEAHGRLPRGLLGDTGSGPARFSHRTPPAAVKNLYKCGCSTGAQCEADFGEGYVPAPRAMQLEPGRFRGPGCVRVACGVHGGVAGSVGDLMYNLPAECR